MPLDNPKFDVAISFMTQDEATAGALSRELSDTLNVFFFPERQKDLAGTDGMESMRTPFLEDCRVMVVLYRDGWGKTRWTAIEETAIKDSCFNGGWKRLFFIALDRTSVLPKWLPDYHLRYNWADFGLEQAAGAIKARVLENGGQPTEATPLRRAEILREDESYRAARGRMNSYEGLEKILESVTLLFHEIEAQCNAVNSLGHSLVRQETVIRERNQEQFCLLTNDRVGMSVIWHQQFSNLLDKSGLTVRELNGGLIFHRELGKRMHLVPPETIRETVYDPEISRAREYGWTPRGKSGPFLSSTTLGSKLVTQFLDLVDRYESGKIARRH